MRKLFLIMMLVIGLAFASNGMACNPQEEVCGPRDADVNLQFQGTSEDWSKSSTGWRGNYNDNASSNASGYAGGTLDVSANAAGEHLEIGMEWVKKCGRYGCYSYPKMTFSMEDNQATADGFVKADSESKAWSYTKDYGRTSIAGAGAKTESDAFTFGVATGLKGCREFVDSNVYVGGNVYQQNAAGETGYYGGFVEGGNNSGGNFYASDRDFDSGRGFAMDKNYIEGSMITKGHTEVSIDPYGHRRSIDAMTKNMVQVNAPGFDSSVFGAGGVGGVAQKGMNYAGGNASFSYNGQTYGNGNATLNGSIHDHGNTSTVSATGHAQSVSDGSGNLPD